MKTEKKHQAGTGDVIPVSQTATREANASVTAASQGTDTATVESVVNDGELRQPLSEDLTELASQGTTEAVPMETAQTAGAPPAPVQVDTGRSVDWYIAEYTRLEGVGFASEWKRGELLLAAKDDLGGARYKLLVDAVLGQSLRHAQRWIKVVETFSPLITDKKTSVEELGHIGMTKLFVIASSLGKSQWAVTQAGTIVVHKDESSPWQSVHSLTVSALESLRVKPDDPLVAMKDAIAAFRKIPEFGSEAWHAALRSLYEEHRKGIEKRLDVVNADIAKAEESLSTLESEKDDLEDVQGLFETFNSDTRRQLDALKAENARLHEQMAESVASRESSLEQPVESEDQQFTLMTFNS